MISEEQYQQAKQRHDEAEKIICTYHQERVEKFTARMKNNPVFMDDELVYSATTLCPCGYGLAYPKECGIHHYWDCSAILRRIADTTVKHIDPLPFALYNIKSESERRGTTRGVYKPRIGVKSIGEGGG